MMCSVDKVVKFSSRSDSYDHRCMRSDKAKHRSLGEITGELWSVGEMFLLSLLIYCQFDNVMCFDSRDAATDVTYEQEGEGAALFHCQGRTCF